MWKWLEQYFTVTHGEKRGIIILVLLSVIAVIAPEIYSYFQHVKQISDSPYEKETNAFIEEYNARKQSADEESESEPFNPYSSVELNSRFKKEKKKIEYFDFDPNKIGVEEWMRLGFSEKQAEAIEKAKAGGWKFRNAEDLKKIFVVGEDNYSRLAPYIKIDTSKFPKKEFPKTVYPEKPKYAVDINTADSSLFERQRGIGPSLASRIVKYRERLGGFISVSQISEVWGMPDSTYQSLKEKFVVNEIPLSKINVNTADISTMGKHPYINFTIANVIEAYRTKHANYKTIDGLKNIPIINDSIFEKMKPYVAVE